MRIVKTRPVLSGHTASNGALLEGAPLGDGPALAAGQHAPREDGEAEREHRSPQQEQPGREEARRLLRRPRRRLGRVQPMVQPAIARGLRLLRALRLSRLGLGLGLVRRRRPGL